MPPITVLIPTRNCGALVPGHVESLRSWLDLAEEVIVVDSESKDGTVEKFRAGLTHPKVRFLTHPPGLYQSWNFGIQNASAKYIYVSTVGDSITRAGVEHLFGVAEKFQADVVISKPNFITEEGAPMPDGEWPIDVILRRLRIQQPRLLTTGEQFLFAVTNTWGAILGSSASNLYRTAALQPRPFPIEYGTSGDGGWGIENIFDVKIAVTPERFSNFRYHEKAYSLKDYQVESLAQKLFRLAQRVIARERDRNPAVPRILQRVRWPELEEGTITFDSLQAKLEQYRRGKIPWVILPGAWNVRRRREVARRHLEKIISEVLAQDAPL